MYLAVHMIVYVIRNTRPDLMKHDLISIQLNSTSTSHSLIFIMSVTEMPSVETQTPNNYVNL